MQLSDNLIKRLIRYNSIRKEVFRFRNDITLTRIIGDDNYISEKYRFTTKFENFEVENTVCKKFDLVKPKRDSMLDITELNRFIFLDEGQYKLQEIEFIPHNDWPGFHINRSIYGAYLAHLYSTQTLPLSIYDIEKNNKLSELLREDSNICEKEYGFSLSYFLNSNNSIFIICPNFEGRIKEWKMLPEENGENEGVVVIIDINRFDAEYKDFKLQINFINKETTVFCSKLIEISSDFDICHKIRSDVKDVIHRIEVKLSYLEKLIDEISGVPIRRITVNVGAK